MSQHARNAGIRIAGDLGPSTAHAEWQAHLEAGRLSAATGPGTTAAIAANRARSERIVLGQAARRIAVSGEGR